VTVLPPGTPAPEFSLTTEEGEPFTQENLRDTTTVLVFYPYAFTSVCTSQLALYEEVLDELHTRGVAIYGVSCDARHSQKAFRESLGVTIPQLSDFEPKGAACEAFGVLHEKGHPQRAIVITGPDGVIRSSYQGATPGELPGVNVIFDGLGEAA
jgi:peroxiredoxin (alkyl hydroperoxide reductase subunit C)